MSENRNAAPVANDKNGTQINDKCRGNRVKWQIRKLFREGGKYTAKQLNEITGGNDARKVISDIRHKDGMRIKDIRLNDGCKLYWLEPDGQPTLF